MGEKTRQVKFTIESDIVSAFKARCESEGVSMASEVRRFMAGHRPAAKTRTGSRPDRRKAVRQIVALLGEIMDREADYRDSIPDEFTGRYGAADHACDQLEEAMACLEEAF